MPVMVKCKICGEKHPSGIQVGSTKEEFLKMAQTNILSNNSENCPKCGKMSEYGGTDYFFE